MSRELAAQLFNEVWRLLAHPVAGDAEQARNRAAPTREPAAGIAGQDDRELLLSDVATIPGR